METKAQPTLSSSQRTQTNSPGWYAVRVHSPFELRSRIAALHPELSTYLPTQSVRSPANPHRVATVKPLIAGVMFICAPEEGIQMLEADSRPPRLMYPVFNVYKGPDGRKPQPVTEAEMHLLRLLCADDEATRCEIYHNANFRAGQPVEVIAGPFSGYQGYVRRIGSDRRVVVAIEGVCTIALPSLHPDLLRKLPPSDKPGKPTL